MKERSGYFKVDWCSQSLLVFPNMDLTRVPLTPEKGGGRRIGQDLSMCQLNQELQAEYTLEVTRLLYQSLAQSYAEITLRCEDP
jgi:hypothetical protein